ncbi:GDSL-type esterase/lipase family protein [Hydrogenophaga sp. PAMC20947]|uniref:GDSL-type esterase/lipase family protein n=1 Tax=Hydrogenophaga sp. PAMC20947 TaxID=2565558 RepID=UPI00109DB62C|nr:GDSL-type esterase/lipase family protein [Hydrogenophaga sp. PAMC20947]QCB44824.1 hypothetical protein E5678_01470 [Hydrogenophaga sp. PAMC20947]
MTSSSTPDNHRYSPVYAACTLSLVTLFLAGCASSSGSTGTTAAASNPFAKNGAANGVQVNVMRVYGDSYTDPDFTEPRGITNWAQALQANGTVEQSRIYAIGGATAASDQVRSFTQQIANWQSTNTPVTERDLSVVYLGYNDIGRLGSTDNLASAKAGYTDGISQLLASGAANGNNRIFVTQITDWSRNPGVADSTQGQVNAWNSFVAGVANENPNIIAVDLQTVFDRVYADPGKFGFVNVTTEDKERTAIDSLYFDSLHYGSLGMELISRVYQHYLTRAWTWASTVSAGSDAAGQLNSDIDTGLLSFRQQQLGNYQPGFSLIPLGTERSDSAQRSSEGVVFAPFSDLNKLREGPRGLAFNFSPNQTDKANSAAYGIALTQGNASTLIASSEDRTSLRYSTRTASAYWMQPIDNFLVSTQLSQLNYDFSQHGSDDLISRQIDNNRSASGWSMESKLRYNWRSPSDSVFTPWAALTYQGTSLNPATLSTLYTTDVTFAGTRANELLAGIGLDVGFAPIQFSGGRKLQLGGGINHLQSLHRDSITVGMTEAGGTQSTEIIQRAKISRTQLALNAKMDVSKRITFRAGYSFELEQPQSTQNVQLQANLSF